MAECLILEQQHDLGSIMCIQIAHGKKITTFDGRNQMGRSFHLESVSRLNRGVDHRQRVQAFGKVFKKVSVAWALKKNADGIESARPQLFHNRLQGVVDDG